METVSTHSRPKAAGLIYLSASLRPLFQHTAARRRLGQDQDERRIFFCFNTQPPEGGWPFKRVSWIWQHRFQHTAARRRLVADSICLDADCAVSTHSRPKAAGTAPVLSSSISCVSTHSRPKAAGQLPVLPVTARPRFNTQPPEGGW